LEEIVQRDRMSVGVAEREVGRVSAGVVLARGDGGRGGAAAAGDREEQPERDELHVDLTLALRAGRRRQGRGRASLLECGA